MNSARGSLDMELHVMHGLPMRTNDFADIEEAKSYVLSAMARAQLILLPKIAEPGGDTRCVDLARRAVGHIGAAATTVSDRHLIERNLKAKQSLPRRRFTLTTTKQPKTSVLLTLRSRLDGVQADLIELAGEAARLEEETRRRRRHLCFQRVALFVFTYVLVVVVPVVGEVYLGKFKRLLLIVAKPFTFETIWGALERHHRLRHKRSTKIAEDAATIRKTAAAVAQTAGMIIRIYLQHPGDTSGELRAVAMTRRG